MKKRIVLIALAVAALAVLGVSPGASADEGGSPHRDGDHGHWFKEACNAPVAAIGACSVQVVTDSVGKPLVTSTTPPPGAYGPAQFHTGYALPTNAPSTQTIAIVDAYDDPNIEADLAGYSAQYGLPACTTANGCFKKVNQTGGTSYPATDAGWALEIALDVEVAHAICQNCKILLVEASSASLANLGAAENEAVALGANVISNSWGAGEYPSETTDEAKYFNHPGVAITVSSGDSGYGVEFPAASQYVTAVGGTTLTLSGGAWATESAWSGSGSGCSAYVSKPAWQHDASCSRRTVADVSADADPNTGAAVYDSVTYGGQSGWFQVGGTSLSAPIVAGVYALTGTAASSTYGSTPYTHTASLHDVTSGNNGTTCGGSYLCTALAGFDGPTGLGTPNGLAGLTAAPAAPDFSVAATPATQTVTQNANAVYAVTVGASGGFSGSVGLSQTGLPAGAVSFSPASATAPYGSTLTVNTSAISPGSYPFTITGTSGATHSVSATLVVQAAPTPDFTIAVSPTSRTISRTGVTTYTVTVTPNNGFAGAVSLAASGFVSGLSGVFSPNPATTTSTFTVTAANVARRSRITLTITGTSGALSHSATLRLSTN